MKTVGCGSNGSKKLTVEAGALPRLILASRPHRAELWMIQLAAPHHLFDTLPALSTRLTLFEGSVGENKRSKEQVQLMDCTISSKTFWFT